MTDPLAVLASERAARAFFFAHLGESVCRRCGAVRPYRLSSGRLRCRGCGHTFSHASGTLLARIRLPRRTLAHLLYLFTLGVPAYRARQYSGVGLKTMQRTYTRFREAIYGAAAEELHQLAGVLELDETTFGGYRPGKRGWGAAGKRVVFGIYKRNGRVLCFPVPNRSWATLLPLIEQHTAPGSLFYTDEYRAYASLRVRGDHVTVRKSDGRPRGRDHVNGIEGFWSTAKHWLYTYRGVPQHHFHLYLKEIEFRFNHRDQDLMHLIAQLLTDPVSDVT